MAESEDKKKQEFDMTGWKLINVKVRQTSVKRMFMFKT